MPSSNGSKTVLLGLGNLLMEDEGVGVHALRWMEAAYTFEPTIQLVDGGTAGFELLPLFEDNDRILMIDAVEFGKESGSVIVLEDDQILTELTQKMSLHHLGITDVLSSAKLLEYCPQKVVMIGVQPFAIDNVTMDLSPDMQARLPKVVATALSILESWGIHTSAISAS